MCYKVVLYGWIFLIFFCWMFFVILGSFVEMEIFSNIIMLDDLVIIICFSKFRCYRFWELKD